MDFRETGVDSRNQRETILVGESAKKRKYRRKIGKEFRGYT